MAFWLTFTLLTVKIEIYIKSKLNKNITLKDNNKKIVNKVMENIHKLFAHYGVRHIASDGYSTRCEWMQINVMVRVVYIIYTHTEASYSTTHEWPLHQVDIQYTVYFPPSVGVYVHIKKYGKKGEKETSQSRVIHFVKETL